MSNDSGIQTDVTSSQTAEKQQQNGDRATKKVCCVTTSDIDHLACVFVLLQETEVELQDELELPDGWEKHEGLPIIKTLLLRRGFKMLNDIQNDTF